MKCHAVSSFSAGEGSIRDRSSQVIEVLPLVKSKRIPQAPTGVAGVFDYHGAAVPLIDLAELALGKAVAEVDEHTNHRGEIRRQLRVKRTCSVCWRSRPRKPLRRDEEEFTDAGLARSADTPYLGNVTTDARGIVQRIEVQNLLSEAVRNQLFANE